MQQTTDEQYSAWCARLRTGDRAALNELFHHAYADLLHYANSFIDNNADAQDVVQEAFLHLWRRRSGLDPSRSLRSLLFVSIRHRSLNHIRNAAVRESHLKERATAMDHQPNRLPTPEDISDAEMLGRRLRSWIDQLPERRREAFSLSRFHGLSYAEIARVMDVSVRTVEQHIRLALGHLRERLREFEPDRLSP